MVKVISQMQRSQGKLFFYILFAIFGIGLLIMFLVFSLAFRPQASNVSLPTFTNLSTSLISSPTLLHTTQVPTPTPEPPITATPTPEVFTYTVRAGDTLSGIADRFSITVESLMALNRLQNDLIRPDQVLLVSFSEGQALVATTPVTLQSTQISDGDLHIVSQGETLEEIAAQFGVDTENIRHANAMIGDAILPGQILTIPADKPAVPQTWRFSILEGNLDTSYPLVLEKERFSLHFTPGTYPAQDPEVLALLVKRALENVENILGTQLDGPFDVYFAGSLFEPPNRTLRGRSFSYHRQSFILHDGTGSAYDQLYITTHELTHLITWNVYGQPTSVMLSEGAAVYVGMKAISDSPYISLDQFCLAYLHEGHLPQISSSLSYQGHNIDLENYYAAGCFAGYLIETYGPNSFGQLYSSEDYQGIYGRSLPELEAEWRAQLGGSTGSENFESAYLIDAVEEVTTAYANFFPNFVGSSIQIAAYRELDCARIALLEGRFDDVVRSLDAFHQILVGDG